MERFNMDEEIFKISRDITRARDLFQIAGERLDIIKILPRDKPYKILEEYYEIVLELITAIMYADGYKTLSHVSAIGFISNYNILSENQVNIIETMRKLRHGIVYYGKKIKEEYLINNEEDIREIIKILNNHLKTCFKNN